LTLLDALILVAATAAALALIRSFVATSADLFYYDEPPAPWWKHYLSTSYVFGVGSRFASMLMLGVLVICLRRPRPPWRRLARRPGAVACAAAAATMAVNGIEVGAWALFRTVDIGGVWDPYQPVYESRVSLAVIAAWAALALGGRWQAEPSAVDRAGRALGFYWVIFSVWPWINSFVLSRLSGSLWPW
jgi:hypothetical protein